eukprot:4657228-Ditylum_brightwellii.AAC.1
MIISPQLYPIKESDGLWKHNTRKPIFALCVDDFGVKYYNKDDSQHLITALQENYDISMDWEGTNYCGLAFKWNYNNK